MHDAARQYFSSMTSSVQSDVDIVEFGSLNINGGIKDLFQFRKYLGVDIVAGPGVDVVSDASSWEPDQEYDVVLCAEVFEHTDKWPDICKNAFKALKSGGRFIGSCASIGRPQHSAIDGGELRSFEYYENVSIDKMNKILASQGWTDIATVYNQEAGDLYFTAVKP